MTLQDALVAYRTYARAEGKSPRTVDVSCVGYFAEFLSYDQQDMSTITGNDLRRFITVLQGKLSLLIIPKMGASSPLFYEIVTGIVSGSRSHDITINMIN